MEENKTELEELNEDRDNYSYEEKMLSMTISQMSERYNKPSWRDF